MLTETAARQALSEHTFTSFDGARLFYRAWMPARPATRALLLFHRGHEHSARWRETVSHLRLADTAVFAWDQRGHGRSPGERGHAPGLGAVIKDADWWARHVERAHGISLADTAVVASSVGAVIAAAWVHDFAPPVRALVLAAPALRVNLYVPFALSALRLKEKLFPGGIVKSYVKSKMLTHDVEQAAAYDEDTFIFRQIAINILIDLHDAGTRLLADAGAIQTPTLILAAGKDWVVKLDAQKQFFEHLGSRIKQFEMYPDAYHSLFHETERQAVVRRVRTFLESAFDQTAGDQVASTLQERGSSRSSVQTSRTGIPMATMETALAMHRRPISLRFPPMIFFVPTRADIHAASTTCSALPVPHGGPSAGDRSKFLLHSPRGSGWGLTPGSIRASCSTTSTRTRRRG